MIKIIEPSEIIVDQPTIDEDIVHVNPWNRFLARFLDYSIFALCLMYTPFYHYLFFGFISVTYVLWIPIEALMMTFLGYTPGKFLLKIKVFHKNKKLEFSKSLKRSFLVWLKGIGLGIPILMPIAMIVAYQKLYLTMKTTWDREEKILVVQKPVSALAVLIATFVLIGNFVLKLF